MGPDPGLRSAQVATGQQHGSTVGMVLVMPHSPPAFLLAGQTADPWFGAFSDADDSPPPTQAAASGDGDVFSDILSNVLSAAPAAAEHAVLSAELDETQSFGDAGERSFAAGLGRALTERGGPVYLEQPDGSVQLKLLVNPLYRPPADIDDDADRDIPLFQAVLSETYQARPKPARLTSQPGSCERHWCSCRRCSANVAAPWWKCLPGSL